MESISPVEQWIPSTGARPLHDIVRILHRQAREQQQNLLKREKEKREKVEIRPERIMKYDENVT